MVGVELYEAFLRPYAVKQWGCDPRELPASIIQRLPVHTNYSTEYYPHNKKYQGIPVDGYTPMPTFRITYIEKDVDINFILKDISLHCQTFEFKNYTQMIDILEKEGKTKIKW